MRTRQTFRNVIQSAIDTIPPWGEHKTRFIEMCWSAIYGCNRDSYESGKCAIVCGITKQTGLRLLTSIDLDCDVNSSDENLVMAIDVSEVMRSEHKNIYFFFHV